ncbi:MAG: TIGR03960 family B12-binding radical SAM protein [Candidatus Omnitrophica bacterium]|nr:TIGR03960 family B12-binding radical SAM protein [Candidatus Omnitrophota bacterium]
MDTQKLEELLLTVRKPARYTGGEWNAVKKEWTPDKVKILLAFPDVYEIGMSNLGMKILYGILNRRDDCICERVFSPWSDFETVLRDNKIELFSLESRKAVKDFDIVGFSLAYELSYTNVINILDLGGVTKRSAERSDDEPLVIAGGPASFNPEPMADFIDAFVIGDGEEAAVEIAEAVKDLKAKGQRTRKELLRRLSLIKGVYVPSLYKVEYNEDGTIQKFCPAEEGVPEKIEKRTVEDLDEVFYPADQIVPNIEVVHDRLAIEIMRGCKHSCAFCQAQAIYRPCRERSNGRIMDIAREAYAKTGYDEISLLSLSSVDHSGLKGLIGEMNCGFAGKAVSIAVPSLRIEDKLEDLPFLISKVKKSGLTFAPESGSESLRKSINKNIAIDKLFKALEESFRAGWRHVKLYFMIGLPGETEEDVLKIDELIYKVSEARRPIDGKTANVTASINALIPKPHTRLERSAMDSIETLEKKRALLKGSMRSKFVELDFHSFYMSYIEAALARGDRRLGPVISEAWKRGARFDGWGDLFNFGIWSGSFGSLGIDPGFYASRERGQKEILPWDFILLRSR